MHCKVDPKTERYFRTIWADSFTEAPKRKSDNSEPIDTNSLGWGHFARLKRDDNFELIKDPANCERPVCRTFKTLFNSVVNNDDVHWHVFNTLCTNQEVTKRFYDDNGKLIKETGGRREAMVRWINAIAIDVDIKFSSIEELLQHIKDAHLPPVTMINETNHGYHIYWILEQRVPATPKAKKLYKHIMRNMQIALNKDQEVMDKRAKDLVRYLQVPRKIVYENYEDRPTFAGFQTWLNTYGEENFKSDLYNKRKRKTSKKNSQKHMREYDKSYEYQVDFLVRKIIENGVNGENRNSTTYVLAMYYKLRGYSIGRTENILVDWNEKHGHTRSKNPHTEEEVKRTVQSAYATKRKFPYGVLKDITGVEISPSIKHARKRDVRVQSHYKERIKDMIYYLVENKIGLVQMSQRDLAKMFDMELSTFSEIIKAIKSGKFGRLLEVKVEGKGRAAVTIIRLNSKVFRKYDQRKLETYIETVFKMDANIDLTELDAYWPIGGGRNKASP